jgi:hypothetical protein
MEGAAPKSSFPLTWDPLSPHCSVRKMNALREQHACSIPQLDRALIIDVHAIEIAANSLCGRELLSAYSVRQIMWRTNRSGYRDSVDSVHFDSEPTAAEPQYRALGRGVRPHFLSNSCASWFSRTSMATGLCASRHGLIAKLSVGCLPIIPRKLS